MHYWYTWNKFLFIAGRRIDRAIVLDLEVLKLEVNLYDSSQFGRDIAVGLNQPIL